MEDCTVEDSSPTLREELENLAKQAPTEEARERLAKAAQVLKDAELKLSEEERAYGGLIDPKED